MYPDDQDREQQPTNRNLMGDAPQPFNYGQQMQTSLGQPVPAGNNGGKRPKSGSSKALPWIISGVLLLFVIIFGVLFLLAASNKNNKDNNNSNDNNANTNQTTEDTRSDECSSKLRRYQNEDLDIRFCYPKTWGDVKLTDGKLDPSDSGTRVRLAFADKPEVHLGLVSDDWSTDVAQDGSCTDPSVQAFPDTSTFSAKWVTQGTGAAVTSALRGLEVVPDQYLLQEQVDNVLTNGVCLEGYQAFGGAVYRNAAATLYAKFNAKTATPAAHISDPTKLVPVADRTDFTNFVKSIEKF
jgi:hypothetical protein